MAGLVYELQVYPHAIDGTVARFRINAAGAGAQKVFEIDLADSDQVPSEKAGLYIPGAGYTKLWVTHAWAEAARIDRFLEGKLVADFARGLLPFQVVTAPELAYARIVPPVSVGFRFDHLPGGGADKDTFGLTASLPGFPIEAQDAFAFHWGSGQLELQGGLENVTLAAALAQSLGYPNAALNAVVNTVLFHAPIRLALGVRDAAGTVTEHIVEFPSSDVRGVDAFERVGMDRLQIAADTITEVVVREGLFDAAAAPVAPAEAPLGTAAAVEELAMEGGGAASLAEITYWGKWANTVETHGGQDITFEILFGGDRVACRADLSNPYDVAPSNPRPYLPRLTAVRNSWGWVFLSEGCMRRNDVWPPETGDPKSPASSGD